METYVFSDKSGLPEAFVVIQAPEFSSFNFFALIDGDNFDKFKMCSEYGSSDSSVMLDILHKNFPDYYEKIIYTQPCFYELTPDEEYFF